MNVVIVFDVPQLSPDVWLDGIDEFGWEQNFLETLEQAVAVKDNNL